MITFKIKPEYIDLWGDEATTETELTLDDIEMIARGWDKTAADVIDNLIPVNYDSAVELMDDDIREAVHSDLAPCTEAAFLLEYMKRHEQKYGTPFAVA